jgi:hypothetical protein
MNAAAGNTNARIQTGTYRFAVHTAGGNDKGQSKGEQNAGHVVIS